MKFIFVYILLSWFLETKSKIYICLALIPTIFFFWVFPLIGITFGVITLLLIPKIVARIKPYIQPKMDSFLKDIHTLAEEARKKGP